MTSIRTLAELLRDRSRWPEGFKWNYCSPFGCAIGLASRTNRGEYYGSSCIGKIYHDAPDYNSPASDNIFFYQGEIRGIDMKDVTPEMVAQAIEDYLAKAEQTEPSSAKDTTP